MASTPMDLTEPARAGYAGKPNPHMFSSPNYYAHALGKYLFDSGRAEPGDVRMGRGYRIRSRDTIYAIRDSAGVTTFERVQ